MIIGNLMSRERFRPLSSSNFARSLLVSSIVISHTVKKLYHRELKNTVQSVRLISFPLFDLLLLHVCLNCLMYNAGLQRTHGTHIDCLSALYFCCGALCKVTLQIYIS